MKYLFLSLLASLALMSCATTKDDRQDNACATYDWQAQGEKDGAAGYGDSRAQDFAAQCGANFDEAKWRAGVATGAERFCTIEGAFRSGVAGTEYRAVCSPMPAGAEEAMEKGRRYGALTVEISDREAQIYEHQIAINRLLREQSGVTGGTGNPAGRAHINLLRDEIRKLQREVQDLKTRRRAFTI